MATVYRLSLVKMVYAQYKNPSKSTPDPFIELRAFMFVPKQPKRVEEEAWKRELLDAIQTVQNLTLGHIFETQKTATGKQQFWFELIPKTGTRTDDITIGEVIRQARIQIDGWEVAKISEKEIMQDDSDHLFFKEERIEGRKRLTLQIGRIYRYMAFFNPDGTIKGQPYDEIDIEKMIEVIITAQARIDFLRRRLGVIVNVLKENTNKIEEAIDSLEQVQKRLI